MTKSQRDERDRVHNRALNVLVAVRMAFFVACLLLGLQMVSPGDMLGWLRWPVGIAWFLGLLSWIFVDD